MQSNLIGSLGIKTILDLQNYMIKELKERGYVVQLDIIKISDNFKIFWKSGSQLHTHYLGADSIQTAEIDILQVAIYEVYITLFND